MLCFTFKALISNCFVSGKRLVCRIFFVCITLAVGASASVHAQSRTPFLDLLPSLTYSEPSVGAPIGPTAYIPASNQADVREQPTFSFVYCSLFQQNVDLELYNSAGQPLVESAPTTNKVR